MDQNESSFLEVLQAAGWPAWARLIYADYLAEQGQYTEADEIRWHCLRVLQFPGRYLRVRSELAWMNGRFRRMRT